MLGHDLPPQILRGMDLAHKTLVAQRLLRRDHERHRGKAAAGAGADGETAGALGEKAQPRPGAVVDLDPSHLAVGVGIEFYRDVIGCAGGGAKLAAAV